MAQRILPVEVRRKLARYACWPPVGWARLGSLRRLKPIDPDWGLRRGQPIDRYYIVKFLEVHSQDVRGRVLEIGDNSYTRRFGGERVTKSDVLHVAEGRPQVTIIGDLTNAEQIPGNTFECIILTQTLQFIYDVPAVIKTVYRILKPGGVVLVTVPGISKISRYDMDRWGHYWSFTTRSARLLFEALFPAENVDIAVYGNVLAAAAFMHGLAAQELRRRELDHFDPDYELLIGIRAVKPEVEG